MSSSSPIPEVSFSCQKPSLSSRFPITPPCVKRLWIYQKKKNVLLGIFLSYRIHPTRSRARLHFFKTSHPSFLIESGITNPSVSCRPIRSDCRYFSSQGHRAPERESVPLRSQYWLRPEHYAHHTGAGCSPR